MKRFMLLIENLKLIILMYEEYIYIYIFCFKAYNLINKSNDRDTNTTNMIYASAIGELNTWSMVSAIAGWTLIIGLAGDVKLYEKKKMNSIITEPNSAIQDIWKKIKIYYKM